VVPTLPSYAPNQSGFAKDLLGLKIQFISTTDLRKGDIVVDFNCIHLAHQKPFKIESIKQSANGFYLVKWEGRVNSEGQNSLQYATECLFGRIIQ
jgi:hypothetical protein